MFDNHYLVSQKAGYFYNYILKDTLAEIKGPVWGDYDEAVSSLREKHEDNL